MEADTAKVRIWHDKVLGSILDADLFFFDQKFIPCVRSQYL